MRAHGKILGLVACDLRSPSLGRARKRLWSERDGRFLVPFVFWLGSTLSVALVRRAEGVDLAL